MPAPLTPDTVRRAPKVLLHDHLDGGLRPRTVLELADAHGYRQLPADDAESLGHWFRQAADSGSLEKYLETFAHTVGVMQHPDAVARVARECALDLAADGVVYAEVRMAPELPTAQGTPIEAAVEAILDGFATGSRDAAAAGTPIQVGALLCAMRQNDRWSEVADLVVRYRDSGVVGFDLAGPEIGFPPDRLPAAIARARPRGRAPDDPRRRGGRHRQHPGGAGRRARGAARPRRPDRGRGRRRRHARPVAQRVLEEQVPLEVAPSSNVQTGAYPSLAEHPVHRLHRLGFAVTVNTDNRLMSGVSATSEMFDVATTFGWSWDDVQTVTERALAAAFLPDDERKRLLSDVVLPGYAACRPDRG